MGIYYYFWKIWLRMSKSGKEITTDLCTELSTQSIVKSNKDIAEQLAKEGVEINYCTLTYIIDQYDRVVRNMVCEGYTVETNNVCFTPELSGNWSMDSLKFDSEKHKCSIKCTLSKEMQSALGFVGVKVLGFRNASSHISQVKDITSEEVNSLISRNGNIIIEGNGIEAMSEDGTTNNCIFLRNENNHIIDISNRILTNTTSQITLRVPSNLEVGKYHLLIHTLFSGSNEQKEKYCQCVEFDKLLWVK